MKIEDYKKELDECEEHIMESMRCFLSRMDSYARDFHKNDIFEHVECLIDTIKSEIEIIQQHRDLFYMARNTVRDLEKSLLEANK